MGAVFKRIGLMRTAIVSFILFLVAIVCIAATPAPEGYKKFKNLKDNDNVCTDAISAIGGKVTEKNWAMFIIRVNANTNGHYVGFELKATTNNFVHAGPADGTLFYSQSEMASTGSEFSDKMHLYVLTKTFGATDPRAYTRIEDTTQKEVPGKGLYQYPWMDVVVLVSKKCLVRDRAGGAWLSDQCEDLIWCYSRVTPGGHEVDVDGTTGLWRPIAPVKWFSKRPNWCPADFN